MSGSSKVQIEMEDDSKISKEADDKSSCVKKEYIPLKLIYFFFIGGWYFVSNGARNLTFGVMNVGYRKDFLIKYGSNRNLLAWK